MVDVTLQPPAYPGNDAKQTDSNWNAVPIITVSSPKDVDQSGDKLVKLPKLPSERFRYTLWHELRSNDLKGSELHFPRVRKAPVVKEKLFKRIQDDQGRKIHHGKTGQERKAHQRQAEDWENTQHANLSFQDLQHDYQRENLHSIMKRLIRAETVQIRDNNIVDLSDVTFNCCRELNASKNFITSFKKLPRCPNLEVLNLSDNSINTFDSIGVLRKTRLETLDLRRNPICFMENYRQRIFNALPNLRVLDGVSRLPSDSGDGLSSTGSCMVM
ncbi:uncharacterized protein LOC121427710 [Lytechinus variegatus]|uniref:uncharacterized protein LOC121427710 n=1 Tax=Lytechinus variegatus TaxID=7654 RepID=UPI001BB24077|nr:uncharacterized protein LOC121427710 [Lytechinus variegatus]